MNKRLSSHLQYSWWIYVAVILIPIVFWTALLGVRLEPKDNEKIAFIVFDTDKCWDAVINELDESKSCITTQPIKRITVEKQQYNKDMIETLMVSRIMIRDIFIFPEALVISTQEDEFCAKDYFTALDYEKLSPLFDDVSSTVEFVYSDQGVVGVYLNEPNDGIQNNFEMIYGGQQRFVAFFSYESPNCANVYGTGSKEDSAAIDIIKYLLCSDQQE